MHGIENYPQNKNVQEASVDPGCCIDLKNKRRRNVILVHATHIIKQSERAFF